MAEAARPLTAPPALLPCDAFVRTPRAAATLPGPPSRPLCNAITYCRTVVPPLVAVVHAPSLTPSHPPSCRSARPSNDAACASWGATCPGNGTSHALAPPLVFTLLRSPSRHPAHPGNDAASMSWGIMHPSNVCTPTHRLRAVRRTLNISPTPSLHPAPPSCAPPRHLHAVPPSSRPAATRAVSWPVAAWQYSICLVLNCAALREIEWHVKHYTGRGLTKHFPNSDALAKEMGLKPEVLKKT
ncbi:hypothetical protein DENSPDRAFT_887120 [Dentipellis sp. KUC8613]|nr:hypothetical protein DENSPDRAFT_887120 [Dentipellis sp. KUC8613]